MDRLGIGARGEQIATDFLKRNGYDIVARNFRTRYGEIDIVAKEKSTIVFVEVKTRSTVHFGTPEEAITRDKQGKLRLMVEYFLSKSNAPHENYRIDSIGIIMEDGKAKLKHMKNVVGGT